MVVLAGSTLSFEHCRIHSGVFALRSNSARPFPSANALRFLIEAPYQSGTSSLSVLGRIFGQDHF